MERRQFVSHVAGLVALALGGDSLTGCATVGAVRHNGDIDPRAVVADWDAQAARLRSHGVPRALGQQLQRAGLPATLIEDGFASLLVTAGYRDLPRDVQQDPLVQGRLQAELPRMADAVLGMTAYLEGLPSDVRRGVQGTLRSDHSPTALLRAEVDQLGRRGAVTPARADQTLALVDHVDFRLRRQDPDLVIDDTVAKVDKAIDRVGGDRREWSPTRQDRQAVRKPSELTDDEIVSATRELGAWTLAFGGLLSVGGLVTAYGSAVFGRDAVALFGVAVWTFGSLVFILGLVMMVAASLGEDVSRLRQLRR
jgi:hypothetical protein